MLHQHFLLILLLPVSAYKHLSSTTFMTDLMPFCDSFGVGAAAKDPSPRKRGPSSHFVICAASLIVNGLTRTVTEIELAAPSAASIALGMRRYQLM